MNDLYNIHDDGYPHFDTWHSKENIIKILCKRSMCDDLITCWADVEEYMEFWGLTLIQSGVLT